MHCSPNFKVTQNGVNDAAVDDWRQRVRAERKARGDPWTQEVRMTVHRVGFHIELENGLSVGIQTFGQNLGHQEEVAPLSS